MNKTDIFIFAGICAISFCYILVFGESSKSKTRKKIDREIAEIIKKLNNGSDSGGNDSTEK